MLHESRLHAHDSMADDSDHTKVPSLAGPESRRAGGNSPCIRPSPFQGPLLQLLNLGSLKQHMFTDTTPIRNHLLDGAHAIAQTEQTDLNLMVVCLQPEESHI